MRFRLFSAFAAVTLGTGMLILNGPFAPVRAEEPSAAASDAKPLFEAQKCNSCHSVASAGIEKKVKSSKAPDLGGLLTDADKEFATKFIKKEVDKEGKKHSSPFKGTDDELKILIDWLVTTVKTEAK